MNEPIAASMPATTPLLVADNIGKCFGGIVALRDVSFHISRGEIYGLIGPNGAGKTTLFNVLTGLYQADEGKLHFDGQCLYNRQSHEVVQRGLARTFQNIRLFSAMSALENVMVGRHSRTRAGVLGAVLRGARTRAEEAAIRERAQQLLGYVGLEGVGHRQASHLSYGNQRRLEIARALATDPQLLALDEPAAGMNPSETAALRELLLKIRADGITVLLIEHDMKLVMGLCDRVAVLDYGEKIAEGAPAVVRNDSNVIAAYLGGVPAAGNHGDGADGNAGTGLRGALRGHAP